MFKTKKLHYINYQNVLVKVIHIQDLIDKFDKHF